MCDHYYDRKKISSRLSGGCVIVITTGKKSSSRLSGRCVIIITTGKKCSSRLSGGCAITTISTTGSDLRKFIRFLREIECIEFECNKFVFVLVEIDLIHFNIQFVLVQLELKLIQIR